jgi:hypothetical protein
LVLVKQKKIGSQGPRKQVQKKRLAHKNAPPSFFLSYLFWLDLSLVSVPAKQVHGFALVYILAAHETVCFVLLKSRNSTGLAHTRTGKFHPYRSGFAGG